ncbi:hypothetical protein QR680_008468 [Steinernema hermaphroditum]|uniref:Tropomodulin n=1 Tax=Steinernema hermaphroditum TaxID=289476 RepID=A0AA39M726_9BILA|nr:hypothetical protein QR680_008468 [Steinernema hermaphroditum]
MVVRTLGDHLSKTCFHANQIANYNLPSSQAPADFSAVSVLGPEPQHGRPVQKCVPAVFRFVITARTPDTALPVPIRTSSPPQSPIRILHQCLNAINAGSALAFREFAAIDRHALCRNTLWVVLDVSAIHCIQCLYSLFGEQFERLSALDSVLSLSSSKTMRRTSFLNSSPLSDSLSGTAARNPRIQTAMSKSDYYAEEKSFAAPGAARKTPAGSRGAGVKLYGRDLRDYDDNDLENLLSKLTPEELEDLNNDFDPDNSLLPPSQRCRNQTEKEPTGPFQREKLLQFLEESAKKEEDWEEAVPYNPGVKRGKVWQAKDEEEKGGGDDEVDSLGRKLKDMEMPIEVDLDDDEDEDDIDDEKFEKALDRAPERDLVDLAGILGMHNILNQKQYYNALKGKTQDEYTGTSFTGIVKAFAPHAIPDEPVNQTNVDDCIKRLEGDDEDLTEVNINNMAVSRERIRNLIKAAAGSSHIEKLSMAGVEMKDSEARGLVELLESSPSLKVLNVESNDISPEMLAKLLRATLKTQVLTRFHADNQRASVLGNQIEMDMMLTIEENDSLLRVGIAFQSMEARHRVSEALERNLERVRLRRLETSSQA